MRSNLILILFLALSLNTAAQVNLTQGLIAYYPFNGNANDASGNNINGAVNGATLTTDAFGVTNNAYEFDGATSYISLPFNAKYDFAPIDSFSISTWVLPYQNSSWLAQALVVKSPFNSNYNASLWNYGSYLVNNKAMTGWAANNIVNGTTTMTNNKCWYNVVVTYKNGIWHLYVNGQLEAQDLTKTHFIIQDGANSTIAFGRKGEASGDYFKGKMDEVRIYNRNLSNLEVDSLFKLNDNHCNDITPIASFIAPDTVCINQNFTITNTSSNATTYNWNFCDAGANANVSGVNLGNIGGNFSVPVFMDYVLDNGNYYGFVFNFNPGGITRLDFGNSLLNTPTAVFLGNPNGVLWSGSGGEDIKLVKQNGNWIAIIVGGSNVTSTGPKIVKLDFGTNITNTSPATTDWGNIGTLDQPHQLHLWQENNIWYGILFNAESNTISRINFTNSFNNTPTGINLGNIGNLNWPSSFQVINDNGIQRIFVSNTKGHSISRLDFGSSLLNTPTGTNLGNPNNVLSWPRGIQIYNNCGEVYAYVCNQSGHDISKLNFNGSLLNVPTGISLGNIGSLNGPHSFSKEFIVGNDKYIFIPNTGSNTLTCLKIAGCTNSSIPNSSLQTPPQISYNAVGTYNINLTIDEGLATQNSFCKQVVVKNCTTPPNPNCQGVVKLTKTSKITPPSPIKNYFPNTGFTWELWFNSSYYNNSSTTSNSRCKIISVLDVPQCQDIVLGFGWPQVAQQKELCFVADGPNGCADRDNTPCKYFPTGGFVPNTWYHVAAVRDYANNVSNLYVNGILVDTKPNTHGAINPTLLPFFGIGSYTSLIDSAFAGKLDEIRFWNYPRTAIQIQASYDKCLNANETGLVAYYHSNEGKGTTLKDASPNANNATLSASVTWDKTDNAPLISTCYQSTTATTNKTICSGQTYLGHSTTGSYNDTTINSTGCDSLIILNLIVLPAASTTKDTITACGSVIINSITYTTSQVVSTTIKNSLGCDSIIQQHLIIITNKRDTIYKQICAGQAFWGHSSPFDTVFHLANNCDSLLHISITSSAYLKDSTTKTICQGSIYNGYTASGIYRDTTKTGNCDTIHILNLIVTNNLHPQLQQDTSICEGDIVNLYPGSFKKYVWNTGSISSSINVKNIGLYWVEVSDSLGCKARDSFVLINTFNNPANFLPTNLQVCLGELYTVNGYKNYNWRTGETTSSIALNGLNTYWLQVTDNNGCSGLDTMKVVYSGSINSNFANTFSPNGDGINDEFKPFDGSCIIQFKMYIFNRWGQKVFETASVNKGWNGMMNNKPLPTDVYYYIINYRTTTGTNETKSGSITLLH